MKVALCIRDLDTDMVSGNVLSVSTCVCKCNMACVAVAFCLSVAIIILTVAYSSPYDLPVLRITR
jgi:hypothetical protein